MKNAGDTTPKRTIKPEDDFKFEMEEMRQSARKGPYSKTDILEMCEDALLHDPEHFYQNDFVSLASKTTDTEELYSEVVSEFLLENVDELKVKAALFKDSQGVARHYEVHRRVKPSNSKCLTEVETLFDRMQNGAVLNSMGALIGILTLPVDTNVDQAEEPVLLAYEEDIGLLWVAIIKMPETEEDSMLEAILEAYTRFKSLDEKELVEKLGLPENTMIRAAALVYYGSRQALELKQDRPMQWFLMRCLSVEAFWIREASDISEEFGLALQKATGRIPECMIEHPVPFRQNPQEYTKGIVQIIKKQFPRYSPIASSFCSESPVVYDACLRIVSDPRKMSAILVTNSLGGSPMKAMVEYLSRCAPIYHGQYVKEPFDAALNPNGELEAQGIDELLAFVFMEVLDYVEREQECSVDMLGIKTASRFLHGPRCEFAYE